MTAAGHGATLERVKGPSAAGTGIRRLLTLTFTLAVTDFRLKFFGSVLGYLWQLMRPLLLFGVLYTVFTQFVRLGSEVPFYGVVLITNIVMFNFFAESTGGAVGSVVDRENVVRKVQFPRLAIPLSVALGAGFNLLLNLIVVFVFIAINGIEPRWTWLELPVLVGALVVMATGLSMLLSALYVRFRDVRPIWDVFLQVVFYASPVLYVVDHVQNQQLKEVMLFNPLAIILTQTRHALIDPNAPGAAAVAGWGRVALAAGLVLAVLVVGLFVFRREAPRIAEEL